MTGIKKQFQNIVIELSDGSIQTFSGKAFTVKNDKRTIKSIKFSEPIDLPENMTWESMDLNKTT